MTKLGRRNSEGKRRSCLRALLFILLHAAGLTVLAILWGLPSSQRAEEPASYPDSILVGSPVYTETRALAAGEYRATFSLSFDGRPEDSLSAVQSHPAARIQIVSSDSQLAYVPQQTLAREAFPRGGAAREFGAFFYVEEPAASVTFVVEQLGELELRAEGFSLSPVEEPPQRLLLLAGRGADTEGWQTFIKHGSANYGLVDGGQRFLAYVVDTLPCGSLKDRTRLLADAINDLSVPDRSLKALGHSMGGLDLRYLVGLAHAGEEPYHSAARKLAKIYTVGTPHHGTRLANWAHSPLAALFRGHLCIGEPLMDDITPEAMAEFNASYPWEALEIDGQRIPYLGFTFQATCLPWWADPFHIIGRSSDAAVSLASQQWGLSDNPPQDLPWEAVHGSPLDVGGCVTERTLEDVLYWILSDPVPVY